MEECFYILLGKKENRVENNIYSMIPFCKKKKMYTHTYIYIPLYVFVYWKFEEEHMPKYQWLSLDGGFYG